MDARDSSPHTSLCRLSTTEAYHRQDLSSLGWELTVCNSLYPAGTPARSVLVRDASYGELLYDHLRRFIPLDRITSVLEIGGGYGYLMKDFLARNGRLRPLMLDISPSLLEKQKETLAGRDVFWLLADALEMDPALLGRHELVILNENLGDFPTVVDIDHRILEDGSELADPVAGRIRHFFGAYDLERPLASFNLNLGAMEMTEKLCASGVPFVFIGEHSCEATVPPELKPFITVSSDGNPRRIALKGHDEYTLRLSYLQRIAERHGYRTLRGPFADYVVPNITEGLKAVLATRGLYSDSEEVVCHFVGDLYEYEYLIMTKRV